MKKTKKIKNTISIMNDVIINKAKNSKMSMLDKILQPELDGSGIFLSSQAGNIKMDLILDKIPKICPKCNSKLKRTGVIKENEFTFIQQFMCKNKKCDFKREIREII